MKILILNWRDLKHPLSGGAEISLFEHAKYWERKKNEVTWFTSGFSGCKNEEVIDNIRIIRRGSVYTVHIWAFIYYLRNKFDNPDIIIDSFHFIPFFTPLYAQRKKVIALINEVAGKIWFENLPYLFAFVGYRIEPYFFKIYANIPFITGSESARDEIVSVGILKKNINIVHHGIHVIKIKNTIRKSQKPILVFLGRVSADKGINDVLDVFYKVTEKVKNTELWIIGKEERKGIVEDLLKSSKLQRARKLIRYFGFVKEEKKFELLKKSWVLIHPSSKEGWGLNVIEAGIVGTPTVGYNVEGLRDSVRDGKTGILVAPGRTDLLAEAAIKVITDKNMYSSFSTNAIQWSETFRWDVSVKKSWQILNRIYEKNKKYR